MNFERKFSAEGAFDKRDPNPCKNYGIHGVHFHFAVVKDGKAVSWSFSAPIHLPHVQLELRGKPGADQCTAFGIHYHDSKPHWEDQPVGKSHCEYINAPCYSDGSYIDGEAYLKIFIEGGTEALWPALEAKWEEWFKTSSPT